MNIETAQALHAETAKVLFKEREERVEHERRLVAAQQCLAERRDRST